MCIYTHSHINCIISLDILPQYSSAYQHYSHYTVTPITK